MLERVMQLQEERDIVRNIKKTVDEKLDNITLEAFNIVNNEILQEEDLTINRIYTKYSNVYKISEEIANLLLDKVESGFLYEN